MLREDFTPRACRGTAPPDESGLFLFGLRGLHGFGRLGVLAVKTLDAAGSIQKLLFAGEEGMAARTDFHAHQIALVRGTGLETAAAGAMHGDFVIIGMNTGFHGGSNAPAGLRGSPWRGTTAASL